MSRNAELFTGVNSMSAMSSNTNDGISAGTASDRMHVDGANTNFKPKDGGGFSNAALKWTPPTQAPSKPNLVGLAGRFGMGMRGGSGGGMLAASRLNR